MLMISASVLDCWASLSLSVICSSPLCRMISMISSLVLLGKNLLRSAFFATVPWDAFQKISSVCKTSDTSFSTPLRQFRALLRQQAISKCLLLILYLMVATFVIFTFVEGCFSILFFYYNPIAPKPYHLYLPFSIHSIVTHSHPLVHGSSVLYLQIMKFVYFLLALVSAFTITDLPPGFSYITDVDPSIQIQPRYYIASNFIGKPVEGYLRPTAILSTPAAYALKGVQSALNDLGYRLVIYDAYRPQRAVNDFIRWSQEAENNQTKQEFYPFIPKQSIIPDGYLGTKSGHTRGSTVDLTIIKANKQVTEIKLQEYRLRDGRVIKLRDDGTQFMCGHFDLFDLSSHHDTLLVEEECMNSRNLLRAIMKKYGFRWLDTQWWHYTLVDEPYPSTYFDFAVE